MSYVISVGARASLLSSAQVEEVYRELQYFHHHVEFKPFWIQTTGDRDLSTSLRNLPNSDFFTKEIDELQLQGCFQIAIHSAKDLPIPLRKGLKQVALTRGQDARDCLVLPDSYAIEDLPKGAKIATSSLRREEAVRALRSDLTFVDIRGPVDQRLQELYRGTIQGLVVARAALIRLQLSHLNCLMLSGTVATLQGQLAIISREDDREMHTLFTCLDTLQSHAR
jgi:hydroxymethylbilane synthase